MIPSSVRIFVCTTPQDMRRSFDGLALAVQERLGEDPQSGAIFVFINKRRGQTTQHIRFAPRDGALPLASTSW